MGKNKKLLGIFLTLLNFIVIGASSYIIYLRINGKISLPQSKSVLGKVVSLILTPTGTLTPTPTLEPSMTPTPTPIPYEATLVNIPKEITEGDQITFTWFVGGGQTTIKKSTVYYSRSSTPGDLTHLIAPAETYYTEKVSDFLDGEYTIPLQFVGNSRISIPGTYYARAYALIDGKNYWSDERAFIVKPLPKNEIHIIDFPKNATRGENVSFTWEISGPSTSTKYTAIVGGKISQSGDLQNTVDLNTTPYTTVFMNDFTNGTYEIPLRYIGNTRFGESGTYYFRAYAYINGKNIWSDEKQMVVQ